MLDIVKAGRVIGWDTVCSNHKVMEGLLNGERSRGRYTDALSRNVETNPGYESMEGAALG